MATENENLKVWLGLKVVPETAKKSIAAGRLKNMTDINPVWRMQRMTEVFGMCGIGWKYDITKMWSEVFGNEVKCFCNINLFVKVDGEWSDAIPGTGGSSLVAMESKGVYVSDEGYKMALTDAMSVAMKALGLAADVYFAKGADFGTKYESRITSPKASQEFNQPKQNAQPAQWREVMSDELSNLYPTIKAEIEACTTSEALTGIRDKYIKFAKEDSIRNLLNNQYKVIKTAAANGTH